MASAVTAYKPRHEHSWDILFQLYPWYWHHNIDSTTDAKSDLSWQCWSSINT